MRPEFDAEKFGELMLYIAFKSTHDPAFGTTKLARILCWSDFLMYALHGKPITGATYRRRAYGPVPEELSDVQTKLAGAGDAVVAEMPHFTYVQKRLVPQRRANLRRFSGEEIAIVDQVIEAISGHDGAQTGEFSHERLVGWQLARDGEAIPYETILLSPELPTEEELRRGAELAQEHGWPAGR